MPTDDVSPTREMPMPDPRAAGATREVAIPVAPTREMPQAPAAAAPNPAPNPAPPVPPSPSPQPARSAHPSSVPPLYQQVAPFAAPPTAPSRPFATSQDPITRLFQAVKEVMLEGVMIVRYPRDFVSRLGLDDQNLLLHGTRFLLGSIPATFFILLPVHIIHGRPITQTALGFLFAGLAFFTGILMHFALRLVGARETPMGATVGLYSYIIGFQGLLFIVLTYPIGLRFGSKLYFGATQEEINAILASMNTNDIIFTFVSYVIAYIVSVILLFWGFIPLIAKYYQLRKPSWLRAAAAVMIPLWITVLLLQRFLPVIRRAVESL